MKKILVIEDDPVNLQILSDFLGAHGYAICAAVDGIEGVGSSARERPDLMLVDIQLPHKNGFEVVSEVRRMGVQTKVLLMSAVYTHRSDVAADGYLCKPFDLAELLARVRDLIAS